MKKYTYSLVMGICCFVATSYLSNQMNSEIQSQILAARTSTTLRSQDNRDPQEINSSAESRKRRRQDELQRVTYF